MSTSADSPFEMIVQGIFPITGRTVFVGPITGGPRFIHRTQCELLVDGRRVKLLTLEGEMIVERREPSDRRSLSTLDDVEVSDVQIRDRDCRLRSVPR